MAYQNPSVASEGLFFSVKRLSYNFMARLPTATKPIQTKPVGIMQALGAFLIWGCFPLYFKQLQAYSSVEIIGHRIVWTFVCLVGVMLIFRLLGKRWTWWRLIKDNPKWLGITLISGLLIAGNWLVYVWAVNHNQVLEASLGYFINPLFGILLSMLFLGEKLRPLQWLAVGLATISVLMQIVMLGHLPWISLLLACTFSVYGIIQRKTPLTAVDAMLIETALLMPLAVWWFSHANVASSNLSFWTSDAIWFLTLAGPITLVPLLLFNKATKNVAFSILSFLNYLTPSMIFLLAVFYYHEPFDHNRLMLFGLIWLGLALFSIDLWQHRPAKQWAKQQAQLKQR